MKKILVFLLLYPCFLFANDAALGSRGGNVFPVFHFKNVSMVKEIITIKLERSENKVNCKFWFKNSGKDETGILMGFPDYMYGPASESMPIRNFTCQVQNVLVETDQFSQVSNPDSDTSLRFYNKWYTWYVSIKPGETIFVENNYVGDWGASLSGNQFFDYLIGTAKTWDGPIGSGRVVFDYSDLASQLFMDTSYMYNADLPEGMRRTQYEDSTVFSYTSYAPEWEEVLTVSFWSFWDVRFDQVYSSEYNPLESIPFPDSAKLLRIMRNEIYARHGYVFNDQELLAYFEKKRWYKPDPKFNAEDMNVVELAFIKELKRREAALR